MFLLVVCQLILASHSLASERIYCSSRFWAWGGMGRHQTLGSRTAAPPSTPNPHSMLEAEAREPARASGLRTTVFQSGLCYLHLARLTRKGCVQAATGPSSLTSGSNTHNTANAQSSARQVLRLYLEILPCGPEGSHVLQNQTGSGWYTKCLPK